jgi:hypothetical protein
MRITIFGREGGGVDWDYPLDEWVEAIQKAVKTLKP